jgi:hypothetical protein
LAAAALPSAEGVPEPGIVLYGKVWGADGLVCAGELRWTYSAPGETTVQVTVPLQEIATPTGESYSYCVCIPAASGLPGSPVSGNVLPVTVATVQYTRAARVDGVGAAIAGNRSTDTFSAAERGKLERVDLAVEGGVIPAYGIAGTIAYGGRQTGTVVAQLSLGPTFTEVLERQNPVTAAGSGSWSYAFSGLQAGAYCVRAFMDTDGDGQPGAREAQGAGALSPIQIPPEVAAADIPLLDPDNDHDQLPDWWENLYLEGTAWGSTDDNDGDGARNGIEYAADTDPGEADSAPGAVAWWRLDDGDGGTAEDASGNARHGTLTNGPAWSAGLHTGALRFDGVDDQVDVPSAPSLALTDGLTLQAWVRREGAWTHDGRILCKHDDALGTGYGLEVNGDDGRLELLLNHATGLRSTAAIALERWVHVAVTFDAVLRTVTFYIDGRPDSTHPYADACSANALDLRLGGAATGGSHFAGRIDEAKVFAYARSARAIASDSLAVTHFAVNGGAEVTNNRVVVMDNACGGNPVEYMASERADFADAPWQAYSASPEFVVAAGDGLRTVYFRVRNLEADSASASDTFTLDTATPAVIDVNATAADGIYPAGSTLDLTVTFSETVAVTGAPQLHLETGADDAPADYLEGSGSAVLLFRYRVGATHVSTDLDCTVPAALVLNGGLVQDTAGNAADLNLPAPGEAHSLSANRTLAVGNVHTVTYGAAANGHVVGSSPQIVVDGGSATAVTAVADLGYHFRQWSDGSTANPRQDTQVRADLTVTALFAADLYTVTFQPGAHGALTGGTPAVIRTLSRGDPAPIAPAVAPSPGWLFTGWFPVLPATIVADVETMAQYGLAGVVAPTGNFLARVDAAGVAAGNGWWDLTGLYATAAGGNPLTMNLVHDTTGKLTGTAIYTVAKDTVMTMPIKGNVKGTSGSITMRGAMKGADPARTVNVTLVLNLTVDVANRQLQGRMTGSIRDNAAITPVNDDLALTIPGDMDGTWTLRFVLAQAGRGVAGTALLTLSNGVDYAFVVNGKIRATRAALSLAGIPSDPVSMAIGARTTITPLAGGWARLDDFAGKGFGQTLQW